MTAPKPAPCPLHPDMEPVLLPIFLGQLRDVEYRVVDCGVFGCWRGPMARTEAEAIALWNAVVASDATRLAAVVKAAREFAIVDLSPNGGDERNAATARAFDDALAALTPDDLALLERWEEGK